MTCPHCATAITEDARCGCQPFGAPRLRIIAHPAMPPNAAMFVDSVTGEALGAITDIGDDDAGRELGGSD